MPRDRSPNLDTARLEAIVRVVMRLPGVPTWRDVVDGVHAELKCRYAWKALHRHPAVRLALAARRAGSPAAKPRRPSAQVDELERKLAKARVELKASQELVAAYERKHVRWSYNAHARGMTQGDLDRPLPSINRT